MSKTKIKPILHWEPRGYGLFWNHLCLVSLEKTERNGTPYYKLDHPDDVSNLFNGDYADVEKVWKDAENCEGDVDFYMEDNGKVHDRLKEIYEQIIADLPYEVLTTEPETSTGDSQLPELQSETPYADKFFRVPRRITYLTLGVSPKEIFERFEEFDLNSDECCCFLDAAGIEVHNKSWRIGTFIEPVVLCGLIFPKHTVAVFQGMKPNSRIALFSVDETDTEE